METWSRKFSLVVTETDMETSVEEPVHSCYESHCHGNHVKTCSGELFILMACSFYDSGFMVTCSRKVICVKSVLEVIMVTLILFSEGCSFLV